LESQFKSPRGGAAFRWTAAVALVLAAGGYFGWRHYGAGDPAQAAVNPDAGSGVKAPPVPVTIAEAQRADFPVYLNGLGTVQPYDTVTVRSRVDGEVVKVGFRQGQMVKAGDVLAQIDPRPYKAALDQAAAKKTQDEATLRNAELDLQRYTSLAKESFASRQQFDAQQALVDQLKAQIQGDQAAIDNAQTQLDYTTIKSPLTGKAGFRLVDPGNIIHAADTAGIVTIVRLQPISVTFTAPESLLPEIERAMAAGRAPVEALTSDGQKTLARGTLAIINNQVDAASGTISMKATFANADNALWPGLSVSTRLLVDTLRQAIVVPDTAVERGLNGLYAYVVGQGNKVEMRDIKVDQEDHGQAVLSQGVRAGEKVVISGQYRLTPGAVVEPDPAQPQAAVAQNQTGGAR
jgi:multidrug efflux system membrane fusion protein